MVALPLRRLELKETDYLLHFNCFIVGQQRGTDGLKIDSLYYTCMSFGHRCHCMLTAIQLALDLRVGGWCSAKTVF